MLDKKTLFGLYPHIQRFGVTTVAASSNANTAGGRTARTTTFNALISSIKNTTLHNHIDFYWFRQAIGLGELSTQTDANLKPYINKLINYMNRQKNMSRGSGKQTFMWRDITIPDEIETANAVNNDAALSELRTIWIDKFKISD
jgi:hypothetical protein